MVFSTVNTVPVSLWKFLIMKSVITIGMATGVVAVVTDQKVVIVIVLPTNVAGFFFG